MLRSMIMFDAGARATAEEALRHPYLSQMHDEESEEVTLIIYFIIIIIRSMMNASNNEDNESS